MALEGRLAPVAGLTPRQRDRMFILMDRHYAGMRREAFESDLAQKQWAIVLTDGDSGGVVGFSTQMLFDAAVGGRPVKALFSGDTIIDREHWGQVALMRVWGRLALDLIDGHPGGGLYWFLIAKGYKTYRFLPVFFREFVPRRDGVSADGLQAVRSALARRLFPDQFDEGRGIIEAKGADPCRLRPEVAEITGARLRDPDVRFFEGANPGHARGDELCCVAPLTRANFTPAAYRAIGPAPAGKAGA